MILFYYYLLITSLLISLQIIYFAIKCLKLLVHKLTCIFSLIGKSHKNVKNIYIFCNTDILWREAALLVHLILTMKTYAWRDMNFMRWVEGNLKNNLFVFLNRKEEGQDHMVRYPKSEDQNTTLKTKILPSLLVCMCVCEVAQSCLTLCNPWTVAYHTPESMGFYFFILFFYKTIWASKAMFLWAPGLSYKQPTFQQNRHIPLVWHIDVWAI
jgi:hypothetical protein